GSGLLILWEVATGQQLRSVGLPNRFVHSSAWSPDGRYIALAGLKEPPPGQAADTAIPVPVQVYDVPGNRFLPSLIGHEGSIFGLSFSPPSRTLASASADTTVLLWDIGGLDAPLPATPDRKDRTENRSK